MATCPLICMSALLCCAIATRTFVDMTYTLNGKVVKYPLHKPFKLTEVVKGSFGNIPWVASNDIESTEHIGTHMDAPYHFSKNGQKIDDIPFDRLHGPGVVINIKQKAALNRDAVVSVEDLENWERENGKIPAGAYVLMNSGWAQYWGDQVRSAGSKNDTTKLHYPGFSKSSAEWLVKNRPKIAAVGSDTISCDNGPSIDQPTHQIILNLNIMCIENVGSLDKIPAAGAEIFAMPMKIGEGTGAPLRMFAMVVDMSKWPRVMNSATTIAYGLYWPPLLAFAILSVFNF